MYNSGRSLQPSLGQENRYFGQEGEDAGSWTRYFNSIAEKNRSTQPIQEEKQTAWISNLGGFLWGSAGEQSSSSSDDQTSSSSSSSTYTSTMSWVVEKKNNFVEGALNIGNTLGHLASVSGTALGAIVNNENVVEKVLKTHLLQEKDVNICRENAYQASKRLKENCSDPYFPQVYAFVLRFICSTIEAEKQLLIAEDLPSFVESLIEDNLASALNHLIKNMQDNKGSIPNYDKQPFLLNLFFHLFHKAADCLPEDRELTDKDFELLADTVMRQIFPERLGSLTVPKIAEPIMNLPVWGGDLKGHIYSNYVVGTLKSLISVFYNQSKEEFLELLKLAKEGKKTFDSLLKIEELKKALDEASRSGFLSILAHSISIDLIGRLGTFCHNQEEIIAKMHAICDPKNEWPLGVLKSFYSFIQSTPFLEVSSIKEFLEGQNIAFDDSKTEELRELAIQNNQILYGSDKIIQQVVEAIPALPGGQSSEELLKDLFTLQGLLYDPKSHSHFNLKCAWMENQFDEVTTYFPSFKTSQATDQIFALGFRENRWNKRLKDAFQNAPLTVERLYCYRHEDCSFAAIEEYFGSERAASQFFELCLVHLKDKRDFYHLENSQIDGWKEPKKLFDCLDHLPLIANSSDQSVFWIREERFNLSDDRFLSERQSSGILNGVYHKNICVLENYFDGKVASYCSTAQNQLKSEAFTPWIQERENDALAARMAIKFLEKANVSKEKITVAVVTDLVGFFQDPTKPLKTLKEYFQENYAHQMSEEVDFGGLFENIEAIIRKKNVKPFHELAAPEQIKDAYVQTMIEQIVSGYLFGEESVKDREFVRQLIEGILLQVFTFISTKKDVSEGDALANVLKEVFDLLGSVYQSLKSGKKVKEAANEFVVNVLTNVLGIAESITFDEKGLPIRVELVEKLNWLPMEAKVKIFSIVEELVSAQFELFLNPLLAIKEDQNAVERLSNLGSNKDGTSYLVLILDAVIQNGLKTALTLFSQNEGSNQKAVQLAIDAFNPVIENLAKGEFQATAKALQSYSAASSFNAVSRELFSELKDEKRVEDFAIVSKGVRNLLLNPIDALLSSTVSFESNQRAGFHYDLILAGLEVVVEHFEFQKKVKEERNVLLPQEKDYVAAGVLSGAINTKISFQATIEAISSIFSLSIDDGYEEKLNKEFFQLAKRKKRGEILSFESLKEGIDKATGVDCDLDRLKAWKSERQESLIDLIEKDLQTVALHRKANGFGKASEIFLKLLFPNGQEDLACVDAAFRPAIWDVLQEQIPLILSTVVDSVLNTEFLNGQLIGAMQGVVDSLKGLDKDPESAPLAQDEKQVVESEEGAEFSLDQEEKLLDLINRFLPFLMSEFIPFSSLNKKLLDRGLIQPKIAKLVVANLRSLFTPDFIQKTIKEALKSQINSDGSCSLMDAAPATQNHEENVKAPAVPARSLDFDFVELELHRLTEEAVRSVAAQASVVIKQAWDQFHAKKDALINPYLPRSVVQCNKDFEEVCNLIFFQFIGSFLLSILNPIKEKWIVSFVDYLDARRHTFIDPFTKIAKEDEAFSYQSLNNTPTGLENFVYRLVERLYLASQPAVAVSVLPEEPVVPAAPIIIV